MVSQITLIGINMKHSNIFLTFAASVVLAYSSGAVAYCTMFEGSAFTINFGKSLTPNFTIPQDAPNGTIIYEETSSEVQGVRLSCRNGAVGFNVNPAFGSVTSGSVFPLGVTGLSFRIISDGYHLKAPLIEWGNITWNFSSRSYSLEIIKTGEILSQSPIPAGSLGQLRADEVVFGNFNLINPITVNTATCQTPSITVAMGGEYRLDEFEKVGETSRLIKFNIALNQCQRGIQKVTYQLKANTPVIDSKNGVVALNAGSSAKGIGLQLRNDAGQPIEFDTPYPFNGFNPSGTDFNIPLSAVYIRLAGSKLEAGTANSEVSFIVSYL